MAHPNHLEQVHQGVTHWNQWRDRQPDMAIDLSGADLRDLDLQGANLRGVDLSGANLSGANLSGADLSGAVLSQADFSQANLSQAQVLNTRLNWADSRGTCITQMRFTRLPHLSLHLETSLLSRGAIAVDPLPSDQPNP
jgi:uncharacterized protein YjbI with pentapeptide repeats